jgi:hypothetical protein
VAASRPNPYISFGGTAREAMLETPSGFTLTAADTVG